jgi:predicted ATP-grasp superfamily ATP-dependent carboligase
MKNITPIKKPTNENKFYIENNLSGIKIRRIQAIHDQRSLLLCIPIEFIEGLDIIKGDYVKCVLINRQLIVEKAEV